MKIKAVIIDDEAPAIQGLEKVISEFCPDVEIVGKSQSSLTGLQLINIEKPDVVFLDIEMPEMNGFELLESIPDRKFEVVFITAYDHYAVKAFKVNAIDYILKPINIKDVTHAVNKVIERKKSIRPDDDRYERLFENLKDFRTLKIHIPAIEGTVCLNADEIIRFAADGRYSMVYMIDGSTQCFSKTLKEIESLVEHKSFLRVHKSHFINMEMVKKYNLSSSYQIEMVDGAIIDVARRKKDDFLHFMVDVN